MQNTSKLNTTACFIQWESSGGRPGLPPKDSPWMKQAVVVSFEVFCPIIRFALSICH